jgi:hypothetical protein
MPPTPDPRPRTCHRRTVTALLAIALSITAVGCADEPPEVVADPAQTAYVRSSTSPLEGAVEVGTPGVVRELLPNRLQAGLFGEWFPGSYAVIVARPVSVEPVAARLWLDDDAGTEVPLTFTDPAAEGRSWQVTLDVERLVAGKEPSALKPGATDGRRVRVEMRSDGGAIDVGRYQAGLLGLGRSIWYLEAWADQERFSVPWHSRAIATIGAGGSLAFPLLRDEDQWRLSEQPPTDGPQKASAPPPLTLDRLVEQAKEPVQRVDRGL